MSSETNECADDSTQNETVEIGECSVIDPVVADAMTNNSLNVDAMSSLLSSTANVELLDKVTNLTVAFSDTIVPMQRQNDEMCKYIDEANEYIDVLEKKIKLLEEENKELKSHLQEI